MTAISPHATSFAEFISPTEELIEEARRGRMFVLVDDEDRENEGDLVIPAQFATPDAINFMAKYARGLICLAMTRSRVEQLGLPLMAQSNGTRHQTAFTVSIEARDGVTTGISAADRARTVAVAINPELGREHIVTPGHVFPLVARDGGTLVRAGHTEAAVDFAAPRRPEPGRRDLRDHERRRHHGPHAGPRRLRAAPRPEARHHRRT
jgi:3,4-dihydroxy 2-butanone 4-phosphate synthase/GTP cyclohydrolase II